MVIKSASKNANTLVYLWLLYLRRSESKTTPHFSLLEEEKSLLSKMETIRERRRGRYRSRVSRPRNNFSLFTREMRKETERRSNSGGGGGGGGDSPRSVF